MDFKMFLPSSMLYRCEDLTEDNKGIKMHKIEARSLLLHTDFQPDDLDLASRIKSRYMHVIHLSFHFHPLNTIVCMTTLIHFAP